MALEDYVSTIEACARCSVCKYASLVKQKSSKNRMGCPSIARYNFQAYCSHGRMAVGLALLQKRNDYTDKTLDIIYQCQLCGSCAANCHLDPLDVFYAMRIKCVEDGQLLPAHMEVIDSLRKQDNMMLKPKAERGKWAERLGLKDITREPADVYFHAGCRYSFDEELWSTIRKAIGLMGQAGVDVGVAGKEETCCGGRAYEMGYEGEAVKFAEHNMEMLKNAGVKTLVTACSDCYWTFKCMYKNQLGRQMPVEVLHITEFLDRLLKEGKLKLSKSVPMEVTYHDPCHLGKLIDPFGPWHGVEKKVLGDLIIHEPPKPAKHGQFGVYEPPRSILRNIPGLRFNEMERFRGSAWCCGAAGGVKEAYPDFALWTAQQRIEEALDTGAEALITACPWCKRNFLDAISESGENLKVMDIVDLVSEAI